jgi:hypothetical protein
MKRVMAVLLCTLSIGTLEQAAAQVGDQAGSCEMATMVEPISSTNGEITQNDSDFFLIQIPPGGGTLTVTTLGTTETYGRLFQIVNNIPNLITETSYGGGAGNFLISESVVEGTYCVEVVGHSSSNLGAYVIQVAADLPEDDHGSTCETGTPVGRSPIEGELSAHGDRDFFHIQIPPGGGTLTVSTLGTTETYGYLYQIVNNILNPITEAAYGGGAGNFLISESVVEGTYCVEVIGKNLSALGSYTFQVSGNFIPAGSCSAANVQVSVPSIDFGSIPIGNLAPTPPITITNVSADPVNSLLMDASFLEDMDTSHFGIVNDTCAGQVLMPGAQCTIRGVFSPLDPGQKAATIMIPCNDLDSLPLEVPLNGMGAAPPPQ